MDAPVTPARVVPRHLQHQHPDRLRRTGTPRPAARICPAPHQSGVPAQQGSRGDDQAQLTKLDAGQQPGQRGQDRPVRPRQHRFADLALEHGELMPQEQDLRVLGAVRAGQQGEPAEHTEYRQISESSWHEY